MTGLIVTGHGSFASGITSALHMIAGAPAEFASADFLDEEGMDQLKQDLRADIEQMKDCSEGIIIFCDINGGCPYKTALELKEEYAGKVRIEVISGLTLGMLMEANMRRRYTKDLAILTQKLRDSAVREINGSPEKHPHRHPVVPVYEEDL